MGIFFEKTYLQHIPVGMCVLGVCVDLSLRVDLFEENFYVL